MGGSLVCYLGPVGTPGTLETCPDDFTCVGRNRTLSPHHTQYCSHACAIPPLATQRSCCQTDKCNEDGGSGGGSHHHHHH
nr:trypsin binding protein group 6 [synthetic construct]